jgi:hypothetical protein
MVRTIEREKKELMLNGAIFIVVITIILLLEKKDK